jgi:hypothetical protein
MRGFSLILQRSGNEDSLRVDRPSYQRGFGMSPPPTFAHARTGSVAGQMVHHPRTPVLTSGVVRKGSKA